MIDYNISSSGLKQNCERLVNQLWKLIPMRENNEDWEKQLDTVINEIVGFSFLFAEEPTFLQLLSKLEGISHRTSTFCFYRKTVFETIGLLQGLKKKYEQQRTNVSALGSV